MTTSPCQRRTNPAAKGPHADGRVAVSSIFDRWWRECGTSLRAAVLAALAAATIYGGGKGDGGNGGPSGDAEPERGHPARVDSGEAPATVSPHGYADAASNLWLSAIGIESNVLVKLTAAWPEGALGDSATLDFFSATSLVDCAWEWLGAAAVDGTMSNAVFRAAMPSAAGGACVPAAFFTFRHREADCQTMRDYDSDGIPDVYELHNGTNPYVADATLAPRLAVGAAGSYTNIQAALDASTNYSIVALAPEVFRTHSPIRLPAHPVMVAAENGRATIESDAAIGAFVMDKGNDARTLVRGLDIVLGARSGYQAAFWCGGNTPWSGLAATPAFEDIRIRAPYPEPLYYGWHFYRPSADAAAIRDCTVNAAGATAIHGIYSYDGPGLAVENCTFANFPADHAGMFIQTTRDYGGGTSNGPAIAIVKCAFDESFTNALPLARLGSATNAVSCFVSLRDCIVPAPMEPPHASDFAEGLCVTNAGIGWNGIARPGGAAAALGIGDVARGPFEPGMDSDGDGLSDYDEAYVHETDPWLADSDGDGLPDGLEVAQGTAPKDFHSRFRHITAVSRKPGYAHSVTNYLGWGAGTSAWRTNDWAAISVFVSTNVFDFATTGEELWFAEFCDIDRDGRYSPEGELAIIRTVAPGEAAKTLTFDFTSSLDTDADGMPDLWECVYASAGLSPTNAADATFDPDGDWLPNLHEYLMGHDPGVADGSNTVFAVASRSIDERIAGKNPTNALPVFLNYPSCGTNLVRNAECWAYGLELSCASPWHSPPHGTPGNKNTVTLLSPRHFITASHYTDSLQTGTILHFVGTNGVVYTGQYASHIDIGDTDIRIGSLAGDITNACSFAKILPVNYANYLPTIKGLPIFTFDQEEKALVCELVRVDQGNFKLGECSLQQRLPFHEIAEPGDSSSPWFLLLGNQPILLTTYHGKTSGPCLPLYKAQIQAAMDALAPGYLLQEADLSGFEANSEDGLL